ncbi:MAG: YqeG family HAD IIIA-type phosphatase [Mycoplasmatota bacterium]
MEKYIPDMYQESIYKIDYKKLKNRGIKCILFDLDNTLVVYNEKEVTNKLVDFTISLKKMGFKIIIVTNSPKVRAIKFRDALDIDCCANARKPRPNKIIEILEEFNYKESEVALIGDQMCTDVICGNRAGITTILITPLSKKDLFVTKINRFREKKIMAKLRQKDLFTKGRYYE